MSLFLGPAGRPVRLLIEPYRNDRATAVSLEVMFARVQSLLRLARWRERSLALELHLDRRRDAAPLAWFAVRCTSALERQIEAALRLAYPNVRLRRTTMLVASPAAHVCCYRIGLFAEHRKLDAETRATPVDGVLRAMLAVGAPVTVELALKPAPSSLAMLVHAPRVPGDPPPPPAGALLWADLRVYANSRGAARAVAGAMTARELPLCAGILTMPRWPRQRVLAKVRVRRTPRRMFAAHELGALWQLPSPELSGVPFVRTAVPVAPAGPAITRVARDEGLLCDEIGPVTIPVELRRQHTAVVGTVEQGKTSLLVASVREDLRRQDCALIVLDPKGDAAEAVLSAVPLSRRCTLLDMGAPSAGFNPLAATGAPDAIADHVVAALRGMFDDGEVRGSSDRYLRNAIIAALVTTPDATLWDVARLLEVGEAGRLARARAAERLIELPLYAELATFLDQELPAQLTDARASTTAKLDAPANKLARVLNSPAVKRVLLCDSLRIDLDSVIEQREVLVVRGALGEIGAGNVSVLMQLLLGMLDAALSRVQDRVAREDRRQVALKIDEAPIVINDRFAQALALKRSAGLEVLACWQTDAQWPPELREQLDALFAHRVLFATASAPDARAVAGLLMSDFADQVRPQGDHGFSLAAPDVRLHLPRHTAIVSWTTSRGRERPFVATTLPMAIDPVRISAHAQLQRSRGGEELREPVAPRSGRTVAHTSRSPSQPDSPPQLPDGRAQPAPKPLQPAATALPPAIATASPSATASPPGYAELALLDAYTRVRWLPQATAALSQPLDPGDRALLTWLAAARCALTSQIHRRTDPRRALTNTQRRCKRLADDGLLVRLQLHGRDGGGAPFCCAVTQAALTLIGDERPAVPWGRRDVLAQLLADVRLVGWLLAFEQLVPGVREVHGPRRARIVVAGDGALALEPGSRPRDFHASTARDPGAPRGRLPELRPAAVIELAATGSSAIDLLIVSPGEDPRRTLESYDDLLSGLWRLVPRYARAGAPPAVVVLCRDRAHADALASVADAALTACIAAIGEPPAQWERGGREGIVFAAEEDVHRGELRALAVPKLPPRLRAPEASPSLRTVSLIPAAAEATSGGTSQPPWR